MPGTYPTTATRYSTPYYSTKITPLSSLSYSFLPPHPHCAGNSPPPSPILLFHSTQYMPFCFLGMRRWQGKSKAYMNCIQSPSPSPFRYPLIHFISHSFSSISQDKFRMISDTPDSGKNTVRPIATKKK